MKLGEAFPAFVGYGRELEGVPAWGSIKPRGIEAAPVLIKGSYRASTV